MPDKKTLMLVVELYRGLQISTNYKDRYVPEVDVDYMVVLQSIVERVLGNNNIQCLENMEPLGGELIGQETEKEYFVLLAITGTA